ncbi:hypothetical protein [Agromyces larvae]|uniref:VWFA domain-containing protein n=1 Tax=Agromyces larvae TaxID=2929802 RepID=A0ABY4BZ41_9MICO|nr:hypothetical protein [Agromyces larvae]UOE44445.1 hypothetical protein MTO99_01225 [Agromyces larvae]
MTFPQHLPQAARSRRARREQERRRRRGLSAAVASLTVGALLLLGVPTTAFAEEPVGDGTAAVATADDGAQDSGASAPAAPTEGAGDSTPPAEAPNDEPPAGEPPAGTPPETRDGEEPGVDDPGASEPGAEQVSSDPADPLPGLSAPEIGPTALVVTPDGTGTGTGPDPGVNQAKVIANVSGDRNAADTAIVGVAGVTVGFWNQNQPGTWDGPPVATCLTDANGQCWALSTGTTGAERAVRAAIVDVPEGWRINTSLVTGLNNGSFQQTPYSVVNTGNLGSGQTIEVPPSGAGRTTSTGDWLLSRANPGLPQICGLNIGLLVDLSASVDAAGAQQDLRNAAAGFVNALAGTPSQVAIHTFGTLSPAAGSNATVNAANSSIGLTPTSGAGLTTLLNKANGLITGIQPAQYTNWDRGLWSYFPDREALDVIVVLTDGNPTRYDSPATGAGIDTRFIEMEHSLASANALKASGVAMYSVGIGAFDDPDNLIAVSGPIEGSDWSTVDDYAELAARLQARASEVCGGTVNVTKQIVSSDGQTVTDGFGWQITAESTEGEPIVKLDQVGEDYAVSADGTTNPSVGFRIDFSDVAPSHRLRITETPQNDFDLLPFDNGDNMRCDTASAPGEWLDVENIENGVLVDALFEQTVRCTIRNQAVEQQADLRVDKLWRIDADGDGVYEEFADGQTLPIAASASLQLAGNDDLPAGDGTYAFGVVVPNLRVDSTVEISETVQVPLLCTNTASYAPQLNNGEFTLTQPQPAVNVVTLTNTVTCETRLTLAKSPQGGPAEPDEWSLDALPNPGPTQPQNPLEFAAGVNGVTHEITPASVYALAEDPTTENAELYFQEFAPTFAEVVDEPGVLQWDSNAAAGATGTWFCVLATGVDGQGAPIFSTTRFDGLNGGVNVPAGNWARCTATNFLKPTIELQKWIDLDGDGEPDTQDGADQWTLTAGDWVAPTVTNGVQTHTMPGDQADVSGAGGFPATAVMPGGYTLSETDAPDGYVNGTVWECSEDGGAFAAIEGDDVTVESGHALVCRIVNSAVSPTIELRKLIDPNSPGGDANDWELSAAQGGTVFGPAAGHLPVTEVAIGEPIVLTEEPAADFEHADEWEAAGPWECSIDGGDDFELQDGVLPALGAGDDASCTITNRLKPFTPTVHKDVVSLTPQDDGSWEIVYEIVVENPSNFASVDYEIDDQLDFGGEITISQATYQPPGSVTDTPFDPDTGFTAGGTVAPIGSDPNPAVWTVTVDAIVDAGAFTPQNVQCQPGEQPGAGGFLNTVDLLVDDEVVDHDDACAEPVLPEIEKLGGTAVDHGDGTFTLPYTITVTNPSPDTAVVYDLEDALDLPADVEQVGDAVVTAAPAGVTPVDGWTGVAPNTLLAEAVELEGGAAAHVYEIEVVVRLDSADGAFGCPDENGLNNVATLHSGNQEQDATGCVEIDVPDIVHDKSVVADSVSQASDGTWTIAYEILVENLDDELGGLYSLADDLHFGTGNDASGATFTVTRDGLPYATSWAGSGDLVVDEYLAGGASVTWGILVEGIVVEGPQLTPAQTACPQTDVDGAFNNAAILTVGGDDSVDTACSEPSAPQVAKTGATAVQRDDATWDVSYLLTVTNTSAGAKPGIYTLDDEPAFPGSVTVNSYTIERIDPDPTVLADDVSPVPDTIPVVPTTEIEAGGEHQYRITLNVTVPAGLPADERLCVPGEPGTGFFNGTTLTSGEIVDTDDTCTDIEEGGVPTVVKDDPTVTQAGDGVWTVEYQVTVTGNEEFVSTYTLSDTLRFGPSIEILSAAWSGEGESGSWANPTDDPTTVIVATPTPIGIDEVHTYTVTVTAAVDAAAFEDPDTTTCAAWEGAPNVGFLNVIRLVSDGAVQTDEGCGVPAAPEILKTTVGDVVKVDDGADAYHWEATYELTVTNSSDTQALVYDLIDAPDFADGVTITDREATSADVAVDPDWNGAEPTTDTIVADQELPAGATHTVTVTVSFTVADVPDDPSLLCEGEGGQGLLNGATVVSGGEWRSEACFDVPVVVVLDKFWVIDGGEPIPNGEVPGFDAQAVLDEDQVDWGVENGPYALGDTVGIAETEVEIDPTCLYVGATGLGQQTLDRTVNTYDVINEADCDYDVGIEKTHELDEGETAVESGDAFTWVLTVTNLDRDVTDLEVTDLIDPTLAVTGPATFETDPAVLPGVWAQTSGDTDSAFAASYTGLYPSGAVTTIRIPVLMLPEAPIETPPAVDPNAPPPEVPPLDTAPIPNTACVAVTGEDPARDRDPGPDCADDEVPVKRIQPAAYVRCIADVPWLYFDIQTTDNVDPAPITVTWTSADGSLVKTEQVPWDARNGRLVWPGAAIAENGVPFEFPGWRPITEADLENPDSVVPGYRFLDLILDETSPTFPWRGETYTPTGDPTDPYTVTKEPLSVTFSINPSQSVLAVYPQALPACALDRPPAVVIDKTASVASTTPDADYSYSLQVTSTGIGAAQPVTLIDEIPSHLRVDAITTAGAPAFPRWENCDVTGEDSAGYGGTLRCDLYGVLGPSYPEAPVVDLAVHVRPGTTVSSIANTGEVCWSEVQGDGTIGAEVICGEDTVTVSLPKPLARTGFQGGVLGYAGLLVLLGGLVVAIAAIRRRREGPVG